MLPDNFLFFVPVIKAQFAFYEIILLTPASGEDTFLVRAFQASIEKQ